MRLPKRMNFQKTSKGAGGGVILNPKIYVADFGPLNRAFFPPDVFRKKDLQHDFPKMSKAVWSFSKYSSVLVASPVHGLC